jgi:virginiamycin B lyase
MNTCKRHLIPAFFGAAVLGLPIVLIACNGPAFTTVTDSGAFVDTAADRVDAAPDVDYRPIIVYFEDGRTQDDAPGDVAPQDAAMEGDADIVFSAPDALPDRPTDGSTPQSDAFMDVQLDIAYAQADASSADSGRDASADVNGGGTCTQGEQRCVDAAVQTCVGGAWGRAIPCDAGYCNGAGICGACPNGASQCSGFNVQTCVTGEWSNPSTCGGANACTGTACVVQLALTPSVVTATQGLAVSGPVAFVADANLGDTSTSLKASIDWGDGSPFAYGVISGSSGAFTVASAHTYAALPASGTPSIMVTVTALPSSAQASITFAATIRPASSAVITEFSLAAGFQPTAIAAGPDAAVWFGEFSPGVAAKIGRITPTGSITETSIAGYSLGIVTGPDLNMWFTEAGGSQIGTIATMGFNKGTIVAEIPTPTYGEPWGIVAGADRLWFTNQTVNSIWNITAATRAFSAGVTVPTAGGGPAGITMSADGNLWFTESAAIGRLIPSTGVITEFAGHVPYSITKGPDGNIWVAEQGQKVGRVNTVTGVFTAFTVPNEGLGGGIVTGPDGNLWYTEANQIARMTTTGAVTEFAIPTASSAPQAICAGPDGNLWFAENTGNKIARITP